MIKRLFVEKKDGYNVSARKLAQDIKNVLNLTPSTVRELLRYDIEGLSNEDFEVAKKTIFSEPTIDNVYENVFDCGDADVFVVEYLPGQYDQRADSAIQCVQLLTLKPRVLVKCAK
ncbi:MAG: phosphoribosylformylglycinamidine synthase, partial [Clostridia bacterium]